MSSLIPFEELQQATGYEHPGHIEKSLKEQGIRFFYGKAGRIWTTKELVNAAGGLGHVESRELKAEDIV